MKKADKENHGGRTWRTLSRDEFNELLEKFFPFKSNDDLKSLRRAVTRDQPLPGERISCLTLLSLSFPSP